MFFFLKKCVGSFSGVSSGNVSNARVSESGVSSRALKLNEKLNESLVESLVGL